MMEYTRMRYHRKKLEERDRSAYAQTLAVLGIAFGPFSVGLCKGYSSPALASLRSADNVQTGSSTSTESTTAAFNVTSTSLIRITEQEGSWIASLSLLGALFGALLSSQVLKWGRKRCLLWISVPFSATWCLTVFANSVQMIYATAFLAGICSAIVNIISQVYISEVARPELRGRLSACLKIFSHLGILASFLMGAWLDWRQLALVCASAPLMLVLTVQYTPESPSYLVYSGQIEAAEKSLEWLKGFHSDVSKELGLLRGNIERMRDQGNGCRNVVVPQLVKPVILTSMLMFFSRFSGAFAFNFYAVNIFSQTFGDMNPHMVAVITATVQLIASMASGVIADRVGRKPLLVSAGLIMAITLSGFALYSYVCQLKPSGNLDWMPMILILVFEASSSIGIQPISWLMVGELFPLEYRAAGSALTVAISYTFAFAGVKTFVDLKQALGLHGTFWLYSGICVLGAMFAGLILPETKKKPLHEMDPAMGDTEEA